MSTVEVPTLLIFEDLTEKRIVPNRPTLKRWMDREDDPFPKPIILAEGRKQNIAAVTKTGIPQDPALVRYSGRRVAWNAADVAAWVARRAKAGGAQ